MYILERLKEYYQTYQCILGTNHVQEMFDYLHNLPPKIDEADICWHCVSRTNSHLKTLQTLPREIQLLKKRSDKRKRASFLYRLQLKIVRRELYFRFSACYSDVLDDRHYYIQLAIDRMIAKYQKNEKECIVKRSSISILYSKIPNDVVNHIIKPYLDL